MTEQLEETMQDAPVADEDRIAHYLCITCNTTQVAKYVLLGDRVPMYAICGHLFEYGNEERQGHTKCVVCLDMFEVHNASHEKG